jgi:ERCC4-related helicase
LFNLPQVTLPTGLGKTFIAAIVMLNFYRWFPTGKIVFCAPTKPLVTQQVEVRAFRPS